MAPAESITEPLHVIQHKSLGDLHVNVNTTHNSMAGDSLKDNSLFIEDYRDSSMFDIIVPKAEGNSDRSTVISAG